VVPPQTPVADKVSVSAGEITWRLIMSTRGGELSPAACHS
jgi:hypothetical protein